MLNDALLMTQLAILLFRLAEGHARLMCHETVAAVLLLDASMGSTAILGANPDLLHSLPPKDATNEYLVNAKRILNGEPDVNYTALPQSLTVFSGKKRKYLLST